MSARNRAYLLLLGTAVIWGAASPVVKYTEGFIPPLIMLLYRFGLSAVIALLFFPAYRKHLPKNFTQWAWTLLYGFIISTVSLSLLFVGIKYSSALVSGMSSAMQPMLAAVAGVIFLKEHVTKREKTGIAIALLGSLVITLEPLLKNGQLVGTLLGNLMLLGSRVADTAASIMAKMLMRTKVSPLALANLTFIIGFVTLLPIVLLTHQEPIIGSIVAAPLTAHAGVWFMAIVSGTIAYFWWAEAQKTIEVGEATLSYYLHPVFTAPLALLWLHERISPLFIVGALITAVGVVLAETKSNRRSLG